MKTNDATRARAKVVPEINRRTFISKAGSAAAAATVIVAPAAASEADTGSSLVELERLIEAHTRAKAVDKAAWNKFGGIFDAIGDRLPICRVQVGRLLGMRDGDGNDTWTPIYAYSDEEIVQKHQSHLDASLSMCGRNDEAKARILERYGEKVNQKKAELAALEAERKRIEDESGHTAALEAARASSAEVRAIEAQIVALVPDALEAAVKKAAWAIEAYTKDDDVYLYDDGDDALLAVLKAIGEARV